MIQAQWSTPGIYYLRGIDRRIFLSSNSSDLPTVIQASQGYIMRTHQKTKQQQQKKLQNKSGIESKFQTDNETLSLK